MGVGVDAKRKITCVFESLDKLAVTTESRPLQSELKHAHFRCLRRMTRVEIARKKIKMRRCPWQQM